MFKNIAKRAMTTKGQRACYVIDHLVEALGNDPSSPLRRALILAEIDENPGITQADIMVRMDVTKSALNREIDWLFNYGCITRNEDGREVRLEVVGYSKKSLDSAMGYFDGSHKNLKYFLESYIKVLKQEKPTLRDARIISTLYEKGKATKQDVIDTLYKGSPSTDNRAVNKLIEEGIIKADE